MVNLAGMFSRLESSKVMVIGDLLLDTYTVGKARRISPEAPVAVISVQHQEHRPGGAGNVVLNLVSLGAQVVAIGRIGHDAAGKTLGRLAVEISKKLIGKHKGFFCDFWDSGDYVVVINASKITVTGNKMKEKIYYRHSGWKGHLKETPLRMLMQKHPEHAIEFAVKGMLPKNKLRTARMKRLKVFVGSVHPYQKHVDAIK